MKNLVQVLAAVLMLTVTAASAATPEEVIAARQANYKRIGEISEQIKKATDANTAPATLVDVTKELADRATRIKGFFPVGTETGGNTKAKPEIWTNRAEFDAAAANLEAQTAKLASLAATGTAAAFLEQYKETGAACGRCHRQFRNR